MSLLLIIIPLSKKAQQLKEFIRNMKIKPHHLVDEFSDQFATKIDMKEFRDDSVLHSSFTEEAVNHNSIIDKVLFPTKQLNASKMIYTTRNISNYSFTK
jgi:hypothetical protein